MTSEQNSLDEIKCPNCGHLIPVTEAIFHQIAEQTREQFKAQSLEQQKILAAKERQIQQREAELERLIVERVKTAQTQIELEAQRKAKDAVGVELEDLKAAAAEREKQLSESRKAELELRKKARELEDKEAALILQHQRRLDEERVQIEEQISKRLLEQYHLKDAEKEKKLRDALIANDELRRKLEQGSQQTQGEVLELELENLIRSAFPTDQIDPVPKGINGADIIQKVLDRAGRECGSLLWESKRTKSWNDAWISKLKDDQRAVRADIAILVSEILPKGCENFSQINGVWVSSPQCAVSLAVALRFQLIEVTVTKLAAVGKNEKMEILYEYLSGPQFKQRVEAIVEAFMEMQTELLEERRVAERRWSKREKQLQRVLLNTSGMYGDFQGLLGASLQTIPALSHSASLDQDETQDSGSDA